MEIKMPAEPDGEGEKPSFSRIFGAYSALSAVGNA